MSFRNVAAWLGEVDKYITKEVTKLLIGNKADLVERRQVAEADARKFAQQSKILFLETSAKTGQNVEQAFYEFVLISSFFLSIFSMATEIKRRMDKQPATEGPRPPPAITITNAKDNQNNEGGCNC
jgi:ribosome biogenesis GTPase A